MCTRNALFVQQKVDFLHTFGPIFRQSHRISAQETGRKSHRSALCCTAPFCAKNSCILCRKAPDFVQKSACVGFARICAETAAFCVEIGSKLRRKALFLHSAKQRARMHIIELRACPYPRLVALLSPVGVHKLANFRSSSGHPGAIRKGKSSGYPRETHRKSSGLLQETHRIVQGLPICAPKEPLCNTRGKTHAKARKPTQKSAIPA